MKPEVDIGRIIAGKYRITAVLGHGGMGVVWRADQIDSNGETLREVAVKTILPDVSAQFGDVMVKRFQREVRAAMRLSNPHVVTVFDLGEEPDGQLYFVMELVDGLTLKEAAPHGLSTEIAVAIASQVCDALSEAHGLPEPIVHRDLKPANLFLQHWPQLVRVKIGDFGIAKVIGEETSGLTSTGSSPGTPLYMSPEQWKGAAVDGRADLYALGGLLYQMLAGRTPFEGDSIALMYKHLHDTPPPLPGSVPMPLRELVGVLLAKDPANRPASAKYVKALLEDIASDVRTRAQEGPSDAQSTPDGYRTAQTQIAGSASTGRAIVDVAARREGARIRSRSSQAVAALVLLAIGVVGTWSYSRFAARQTDQGEPPDLHTIAAANVAAPAESTATKGAEASADTPARLPPESVTYVDNRDGTITDTKRGLVWEKLSDDGGIHDKDAEFTWEEALGKARELNSQRFAGHKDWRIPAKEELLSLVDEGGESPKTWPLFHHACEPGCSDKSCSCTQPLLYWSSTTFQETPSFAWPVRFSDGHTGASLRTKNYFVRAVRSNSTFYKIKAAEAAEAAKAAAAHAAAKSAPSANAYVDNGDGTITDTKRALMWEKLSWDGGIHDVMAEVTWEGAFDRAEALNAQHFAGHADWRVPTKEELSTLVDESRAAPKIWPLFHHACRRGCSVETCSCTRSFLYWSSTEHEHNPSLAWFLGFFYGAWFADNKTDAHYVRAVRSDL